MTGKQLKQRRQKLEISQESLAERWDIPQATLSRWESEKHKIQHPKILDDAMKTVEREVKDENK